MSLPDWIIERIHLGEVPVAWRERAQAAQSDPEIQRKLAELEASDRAILVQHPPATVVESLRKRAGERTRTPMRLAFATVAAAAAALVLFFALREQRPGHELAVVPADGGQDVRLKGSATLFVHRQTGGEPELLHGGDSAKAGQRLQLGYAARGARYGAILSIDGNRAVTLHWPAESGAEQSALLEDKAVLPFSYELDDAPSFERFVFVTSAAPFALAPVLDAARDIARRRDARTYLLALDRGLDQTSFVIHKESAP